MLTGFFDWLEANPLRWHIANILQLTAILALIGTPELTVFVGLIGLMAALVHASLAGGAALERQGELHPYDVALAFVPAGIALTIAAAGLWISVEGARPVAGLVIYAVHLSLAAWRTHDVATGAIALSARSRDVAEAR